MITGATKDDCFICDRCRARGRGVLAGRTAKGSQPLIEPDGWTKAVEKRPAGTVIRHYCPDCQETRPALRLHIGHNKDTRDNIAAFLAGQKPRLTPPPDKHAHKRG